MLRLKATIETAVRAGPLVVLSLASWLELAGECGGADEAAAWLLGLAEQANRPIGVHGDGQTLFLAPRAWSEERLAGYIGGRHGELEQIFGPAAKGGVPR